MDRPPQKRTSINNSRNNKLRDIAQIMSSKYLNPQRKNMIEVQGDKHGIYISNEQNRHQGKWVILQYDFDAKKYLILYNENGVSGRNDETTNYGESVDKDIIIQKINAYFI